jgi:uncharacterized repeat protein (TIGR03803 family)
VRPAIARFPTEEGRHGVTPHCGILRLASEVRSHFSEILLQTSPLAPPVQSTNGLLYGVTEFGGNSNNGTVYSLDMGLAPFVNLASFTGKQGNTVTLLGTHLKGAITVTFNGLAANFKVLFDTYLTATVPAGAATGPIEVTTPNAVLQSRKHFIVKH